jgi:hydrogenase small subunit
MATKRGCTGDTISFLNSEQPGIATTLKMLNIHLLWHPLFSLIQGEEVKDLLEGCTSGKIRLDILIVEGAIQ